MRKRERGLDVDLEIARAPAFNCGLGVDEVSHESLTKQQASALLCGFKRSAYEVPTTGDEGRSSEKRIKEDLRLVEIGRASAINELQKQSVPNALVLLDPSL